MIRFNTSLTAIGLVLFAASGILNAETGSSSHLDLEPCINGGVSASGRFPTQAMEDQFHAYVDAGLKIQMRRRARLRVQYPGSGE